MADSNTGCLMVGGRCIFCDRPVHLQATDAYTCPGPEASIDENVWHIRDAEELPKWAWPLTEEEDAEFTRWLNKFDGDPFEPTPTRQLQHFAEIRGFTLPPYRPRTDVLPLMLSEAFEVNGTIDIGSGYYLWWLVSKDNYEPEDAERLIADSGLAIRDDALGTMVEFHRNVLRLEASKEVKRFKEFLEEGLLPRGALVIAVHRFI